MRRTIQHDANLEGGVTLSQKLFIRIGVCIVCSTILFAICSAFIAGSIHLIQTNVIWKMVVGTILIYYSMRGVHCGVSVILSKDYWTRPNLSQKTNGVFR